MEPAHAMTSCIRMRFTTCRRNWERAASETCRLCVTNAPAGDGTQSQTILFDLEPGHPRQYSATTVQEAIEALSRSVLRFDQIPTRQRLSKQCSFFRRVLPAMNYFHTWDEGVVASNGAHGAWLAVAVCFRESLRSAGAKLCRSRCDGNMTHPLRAKSP